jgi:hypothetical protein
MSTAGLKPGEKCPDCSYIEPKPVPPKPKVNHLQVLMTQFCCGMAELGNFNYVDPPDGKKMTHYHKVGGWQSQPNAEPTTKEEILERMKSSGGVATVCTTGAGQEYLDAILPECGFTQVSTFTNPSHANTPVKIWVHIRKGSQIK